jgi:hypothetical protein
LFFFVTIIGAVGKIDLPVDDGQLLLESQQSNAGSCCGDYPYNGCRRYSKVEISLI